MSNILAVIELLIMPLTVLGGIFALRNQIWYFFLRDAISEKIRSRQSANAAVKTLAADLLRQIEAIECDGCFGIAKNSDLVNASRIANAIYSAGSSGSSHVATDVYFLEAVVRPLRKDEGKSNEKGDMILAINKDYLYDFLYKALAKIERDSSTAIEVPTRISVVYRANINPDLRRYVKGKGVKSAPGVSEGIDTSPTSLAAVDFYYSIIDSGLARSQSHLHKNFFQVLGANDLLYIGFLAQKVWFPLKLVYQEEGLFGELALHLVRFNPVRIHHNSSETSYLVYELYYSNLRPFNMFVQNIKSVEVLKKMFSSLQEPFDRAALENVQCLGDETIKVRVCASAGEQAYATQHWKMRYALLQRAGRSKAYCYGFRVISSARDKVITVLQSARRAAKIRGQDQR